MILIAARKCHKKTDENDLNCCKKVSKETFYLKGKELAIMKKEIAVYGRNVIKIENGSNTRGYTFSMKYWFHSFC